MTVPDEERLARATLCAIAEPGEALLGRLIDRVGARGALAVVRGTEPVPDGVPITDRARARLAAWQARLAGTDPETDLEICDRIGGRMICPGDPEWPAALDDLGDHRPYALWLRGSADLRHACLRAVAIVGARAASPYGTRIAADLGAELADAGWTVISGGALGIDGAAHRGTLAVDGRTIAVFAGGVDRFYPPRNEVLFLEIIEHGLLVSESPPGTDPSRLRFLIRNRLIAALARGTVVIEAAARSGALNTAAHTRDLGRPLMAVPGPVDSLTSVGCHRLLREVPPARCVTNSAEVLEEIGTIGVDLAPVPQGPLLPHDALDPTTRAVLEALPARGSAGTAQIAVKAGVDLSTATGRLGQLAAAGFVERAQTGWRLRRPKKPRPSRPP
ncbi:DNA-processing protein DprA [Thermomonospora cellulosilytica]|uniref:DNA processing protein n=1 Tax=Thermomonospora cellulosilytica TaxID=1411118 RepID=A0A7W3N3Y8_9ACTN|nr:DNA-processing protein DprA [Thermomonospora cellulosilytica]MBA9007104.1 DNA processing protein [Thermomonospora cellulosilytica]